MFSDLLSSCVVEHDAFCEHVRKVITSRFEVLLFVSYTYLCFLLVVDIHDTLMLWDYTHFLTPCDSPCLTFYVSY